MRRSLLCVAACCLLLTACARKTDEQVHPDTSSRAGEDTVFSDTPDATLPATSEERTQLKTDEEEKEEQEKQETGEEENQEEASAPESKPEEPTPPPPPPPPKYAPLTTVSADAERIVSASGYGLSAAMEDILLALQNRYYQSVGALAVQECDELFSTPEEANRHEAIWRSLVEIRKASLIDLHLADYGFTFYCTNVSWNGEEEVRVTLLEDAVMYFASTSYVPSEQFDVSHTFTLCRTGQDSWQIKSHTSDDNPYENFAYDKVNQCDSRLSAFLGSIASRQAQRGGGGGTSKTWQHDYDRSAAYAYMQTYAAYRNGDWRTYDYSGGNCQNFGSQVLHAGGIPMDQEGEAQWYWKNHYDQNYSWINVTRFANYARSNTGYGLVADADANYYDGQIGDILIMGDGGMEHTTVIADTITDGSGTVDYLICSNTGNYRNFPASAYYYTYHWVVRIFGWNDIEPPAGEEAPPAGEGGTSETPGESGGETGDTPPADSGETPPVDDGGETPLPDGEGENPLPDEGGETPPPGDGEEMPPSGDGGELTPEGGEAPPSTNDGETGDNPEDTATSA